jgi:hypothetical protein
VQRPGKSSHQKNGVDQTWHAIEFSNNRPLRNTTRTNPAAPKQLLKPTRFALSLQILFQNSELEQFNLFPQPERAASPPFWLCGRGSASDVLAFSALSATRNTLPGGGTVSKSADCGFGHSHRPGAAYP